MDVIPVQVRKSFGQQLWRDIFDVYFILLCFVKVALEHPVENGAVLNQQQFVAFNLFIATFNRDVRVEGGIELVAQVRGDTAM